MNTEELIKFYGEKYRGVIEDSIRWLDEREEAWELSEPMNRTSFIASIIARIVEVK